MDHWFPQNLTLVKCLPQVGEAFRALVHVNWVRASYGVASLYVLADTRDKAVKMMKRTDGAADETEKKKKVAAAAFDTLLWQVG
jgi:mitochondrial fission process protein 1